MRRNSSIINLFCNMDLTKKYFGELVFFDYVHNHINNPLKTPTMMKYGFIY